MGRRGSNDSETKIRLGVLGLLESEVTGVHCLLFGYIIKTCFHWVDHSENENLEPNKSQINFFLKTLG